jgi:preprotein translocase subunit SecB
MSEKNKDGEARKTAAAKASETEPEQKSEGIAAAAIPPLTVIHQYLKDMSFENPIGAEAPSLLKEAPTGMIRVDVRVKPAKAPDIEVALHLAVDAKIGEKSVYLIECEYAGLFRLGRVAQEHMLPLVMIEAPRLLFPFARQIVAAAVAAGGFPPLLINPVDFVAMFRDKREEMLKQLQEQQKSGTVN